jgi:hypothetical protein
MKFCNTTIQITVAFFHHTKQDTSIASILHHIKLTIAVLFLYINNLKKTNKQPPSRTPFSHTIMPTSQEIPLLENLNGDYSYKTLHLKI